MAKLKIVGRAKLVFISQALAEKLIDAKNKFPADHIVEVGQEGTMELGQIKQILLDDSAASEEAQLLEQKMRERQVDVVEWNDYVNRCRQESIEQKARRMVNSWCALLWTARMNKPVMQIPDEIKDELMIRLIKYFEENPNEWHATQDVYKKLIPFGQVAVVSNVEGMKSIGQAMQGSLI